MNQLLDQKVKERTKELESSRDELLKVNHERDILISRTSNDIKSSLATIKGLCSIALKDVSDPQARQYIDDSPRKVMCHGEIRTINFENGCRARSYSRF